MKKIPGETNLTEMLDEELGIEAEIAEVHRQFEEATKEPPEKKGDE